MSIRMRWLGYVCFEIVLPSGKVLVIDPYIDHSSTAPIKCDEVTGADYIAVTHGHYDHITDVGALVERFGSKVICSHDVAAPLTKLFGLDPAGIIEVTAGDTADLDGLGIEVRRGEHIDLSGVMESMYERVTGQDVDPEMTAAQVREAVMPVLSRTYRPALREMMDRIGDVGLVGGEQLTFVFVMPGNLRVLVFSSGPYDSLRDEVTAAGANVYLGQLGGVDPALAAEFAALSGAELVIPTHHDGTGEKNSRSLAAEMAKQLAARSPARFLDAVPGRWYEIGVAATAL
ncbi:MAG: MBL fold metallo-hydrolase [Dehalococcoidales bacterium]